MKYLNLEKTYEDFKNMSGSMDEETEQKLKDAFMFGATSVVSYMTEDVAATSEDEAVEAINNLTVQVSDYWASVEADLEGK